METEETTVHPIMSGCPDISHCLGNYHGPQKSTCPGPENHPPISSVFRLASNS